jgi:hypothetical protein
MDHFCMDRAGVYVYRILDYGGGATRFGTQVSRIQLGMHFKNVSLGFMSGVV